MDKFLNSRVPFFEWKWGSFVFAALFSPSLFALSIVLPDQPILTEKTAANELSEYLTKVTGQTVPVMTESKPGFPPHIYVGNTKSAGKHSFAPEAWEIRANGKNEIFLQGGSPRGILYAAWEFLEHIGILWLDEESTYIPHQKEIVWDADWHVSGEPAIAIRGIYGFSKEWKSRRPYRLWQARNKLNFYDEPVLEEMTKYGITPTFGSPKPCHSYALYSKDWKGKEAECYAMDKDGKRLPPTPDQRHGQVCLTNPETVHLFAVKLREFIQNDRKNGTFTQYYDVSSNDNADECMCRSCQDAKKKYGSYGGVALAFTNKLAEEIEKDYPEIRIQMFAYYTSAEVPSGIKAHKNVIIRIAQMGAEFLGIQTRDTARPLTHPNNKQNLERFAGWSKIGTIAIWDYWILFSESGITAFHKAIAENIRKYRDWGAVEVFAECERPMTNLFYSLRFWLGARLLCTPDRNLENEITRFMKAYYGEKAAPYMQRLLDDLQEQNDSLPFSLSRTKLINRPDLNPNFFRHADFLIEKALSVAETDLQKKHIRKERFALDRDNLLKFREKAHPDMAVFKNRLREDFELNAPLFMNKKTLKKEREELERLIQCTEVKVAPLVGFDDYEILHDIAWPFLKKPGLSDFAEMPDAASGKALYTTDTEKYSGLSFGLYDPVNKKHLVRITIPQKKIPQDEKFHYYSLGRVELVPQCYVWAHPTWRISQDLDEYYSRIMQENNFCEIFVSLKAEGPRYVKGSAKANALALDRILLVRPKKK